MDALEEALRRAGRRPLIDDPEVARELRDLTRRRSARPTRARLALPVLIGSGALLFTGAGAVAVTQFGPWSIADPDYVVARDWSDTEGTYLGSCESHARLEHDDPEALAEARRILEGIDLQTLPPDQQHVAGELFARGTPGDYDRLIGGEEPDWSTFSGSFDTGPEFDGMHADARVLQNGLIMAVHNEIVAGLQKAGLDAEFEFGAEGETQCTTDPDHWVELRDGS